MERTPEPARASLALAAALLWAAWPPPPPPAPSCPAPGSSAAAGGWTRAVACREPAAELRGPARLLFGRGIDPNRADAATLEVLPGIGPEKARALVRSRQGGAFCRQRDLERARGVGPQTRRRIQAWLELTPCPPAPPAPTGP